MTQRPGAREFIGTVVDEGSFRTLPSRPTTTGDPDYAAALEAARESTGLDESVLCGTATLDGRPVVVVTGEFGFLGGSVGTVASTLVLEAVEHATAHRLPYLVHLRHPTTGGVMASWASLGQVTTAQPGALVGFLGPRVAEALVGERIPDGIQRSEHLAEVGVIDAVVPDDQVRAAWARVLRTMLDGPTGVGVASPPAEPVGAPDAWEAVLASLRADRPGIVDLLATCATDAAYLSGTGDGEVDPSVEMGLVRLCGQPCVVIGTCRERQRAQQLGPAALRMAQRAVALAGELGLPVVTVVDTPGAALSAQAESDALSGEIARTLAALVAVRTPVLSVLMEQGSGGAALALMPSDASIVARNGWLAPLPPEGSSAIVFRDASHADEMARRQGIDATSLLRTGIVDEVVPEPDEWTDESRAAFCRVLGEAVAAHLDRLSVVDEEDRLARRRERSRSLG